MTPVQDHSGDATLASSWLDVRCACKLAADWTQVPRYFLHICNGNGFTEDEQGQELPNADAARNEAIRGLRDISAAELKRGEMNLGSFIEIEDEAGRLIMTVDFHDAVRVANERGQRPSS